MLALLPNETSILPQQNDSWELGLCFNLSGAFGRYYVELFLDREMLPSPLDYIGEDSFSLSPGGFEVDFRQTTEGIEKDQRRAWFCVTWFTSKWLQNSGTTIRKRIAFRWADPNHLPKKISLLVKIYSFLRQVLHQQELAGINARDSLVKVIGAQPGSHFYFPGDSTVVESSIGEIHSIMTEIQGFSDTTSWSFTWPEEVVFWESEEGTQFLASQLARMWKEKAPESAVRLAMCPFSLAAPDVLRVRFLEELEVHSACFVRIAVITPERLSEVKGDTELIVGGFGRALGFRWDSLKARKETDRVSVFLETDRIAFLRQEHREIWKAAQPWPAYKRARGVEFSSSQASKINARASAVIALAKKLLLQI